PGIDVSCVAWSADDSHLISATGYSGELAAEVTVREVSGGAVAARLQGHTSFIDQVVPVPGRTLLLTGSPDRTIRLCDLTRPCARLRRRGHVTTIRGITFTPDGARFASVSHDGSLQLWHCRSGRSLYRNTRLGLDARPVFSPDGEHLAIASRMS